jgi:hypothetical protein
LKSSAGRASHRRARRASRYCRLSGSLLRVDRRPARAVQGQRSASLRRRHLKRLEFIAAAQRAGFTLREIAELSDGFDIRGLATRKLPEAKAELKLARDRKRWLDAASTCDCPSPDECTLFEGEGALRLVQVDGCRRPDAG